MSFIGGIKAFFEGWKKTNDIPDWVLEAYYNWEAKLGTHPYNMTKHFVGSEFIYRVRHGIGNQGEAPIIGWYKKKKNLKNHDKKSWKKIDKVPKWVKFPLTDNSNFIFHVKGKNYEYKIKVYNYKTMTQKEKVWKMRR